MFNGILAFLRLEPLVILIVFGIPVILIVLVFKFISKGKKERLKQRLEIGKLADELEQIRKKIEPNEKTDSPSESG